MNKPLISIEELTQIALREIHTLTRDAKTYPRSVFIPSQMRWPKETWSVQVVSSEGVDPQATGRAAIYLQHTLRHEYNLLTG